MNASCYSLLCFVMWPTFLPPGVTTLSRGDLVRSACTFVLLGCYPHFCCMHTWLCATDSHADRPVSSTSAHTHCSHMHLCLFMDSCITCIKQYVSELFWLQWSNITFIEPFNLNWAILVVQLSCLGLCDQSPFLWPKKTVNWHVIGTGAKLLWSQNLIEIVSREVG